MGGGKRGNEGGSMMILEGRGRENDDFIITCTCEREIEGVEGGRAIE